MANLLILHGGRTVGPYTAEEARGHLAHGHITPDTPAWTEGLLDWSTLSSVLADLSARAGASATPEFTRIEGRVLLHEGVAGFCWGALLATPFWCLAHRMWIGLLSFIPGVGQFVQLWLAFNGRELAWRKGSWRSVADFARAQRRWTQGALLGWTLLVLGLAALLVMQKGRLVPQQAEAAAPAAARPPATTPAIEEDRAQAPRPAGMALPVSRQEFERQLRDRTLAEVRALVGPPAYERENQAKGVNLYVYRRVTLQPGRQTPDDVAVVAFVGGRARAFQFMQEKKP